MPTSKPSTAFEYRQPLPVGRDTTLHRSVKESILNRIIENGQNDCSLHFIYGQKYCGKTSLSNSLITILDDKYSKRFMAISINIDAPEPGATVSSVCRQIFDRILQSIIDEKIINELKIGEIKQPMDFNFGYLWGSYISKVDVKIDNKILEYFSKWCNIPDIFFQSNIEFIKGVLSSFVDNDGIIDVNKRTLRFCSKNREYLSEIGLLMNYLGIFGILGENDTRIKTLSVSRKYASIIKEKLKLSSMVKKIGRAHV